MQLVVADANVMFAGLLDPDSLYRKLLVVFAWAKFHADRYGAREMIAEMEQVVAENPGARIGGAPDPEAVVALAEARIALLAEHLPTMTPTDFGLVTSPPITEEIFHNATGKRSVIGSVSEQVAEGAVAAALAISMTHQVQGFAGDIPGYTEGRDVKDDPIIHTAILARADWVLSQDKKHITLSWKRPTPYKDPHTGRETGAIGLNYFISKLLCTALHFDDDDLRSIDGALLDAALRVKP